MHANLVYMYIMYGFANLAAASVDMQTCRGLCADFWKVEWANGRSSALMIGRTSGRPTGQRDGRTNVPKEGWSIERTDERVVVTIVVIVVV